MSDYVHALGLLAQSAHALPKGDSVNHFNTLIKSAPERKEAYLAFALYLANQGDLDHAHKVIDQALMACARDAELDYIKARLSDESLDYDNSILFYRRCLALAPNHRKASFHLALALLTTGDLPGGAALYNNREFPPEAETFAQISPWDGSDRDTDILLWAEQGLGDELMFFRLLPHLESYHGRFTVQCDPRLVRLLASNFPRFHFIPRNQPIDDLKRFSLQAPIGHLLTFFYDQLSNPSIQRRVLKPIIKPELNRQLEAKGNRLNIGLSWLSMNPERGVFRSIPLDLLLKDLSPERHRLINLQYLAPESEIQKCRSRGFDCVADIDCFQNIEDMTYAIAQCDAIVTIDNSTLHLAGSLGTRTLALLPRESNWRWQWDSRSTYWYPTVELLRQDNAGDWSVPLEGLKSL